MAHGEWKDAARALIAEHPDWNDRQIAEVVGVGTSSVWRLRHPERAKEMARKSNAKSRARKREWNRTEKARRGKQRRSRAYRAACERCGGPCGIDSKRSAVTHCLSCSKVVRRENHEALLDRVEEMYNAGLKYAEMAAALGRSAAEHVCPEVAELRRRGRIGRRYSARAA